MHRRRHPCACRSGIRALIVGIGLISGGERALAQPLAETDGELEVVVRGDSSGAYAARAAVDEGPRAPIDAAAVLGGLPGVHVRRLGADGSFAALSVRGSASNQVGVFLAGIPLTGGADPSFDVGSLLLWPGSSFRVYRSFAPAALGTTGYLGGVLAIEPPAATEGGRTSWWTAAGSFGGMKLRVGEIRRVGPLTVAAGLSAARADNDFPFDLPDPPAGAPLRLTRTNAGYASAGVITRATLDLGWGTVGALVFGDARRHGLPGDASSPNATTTASRLEIGRVVTGADVTARTGAQGAARALVWARREGSTFADPLGELTRIKGTLEESTSEAAGVQLGWRGRPVEPLSLGLVVDARAERFSPDDPARIAARRLAAGAGVDATWRAPRSLWSGPPLSVAASARLDARDDEATGIASDELVPSGHVGVTLALSPAAILSAHAGALRRSPSFPELYGSRGTVRGNPRLLPERALSADAGVHGEVGGGGVRLDYELVGFANAQRDLIGLAPLGLGTFETKNLGPSTLLGAELSLALTTRRLRTSASYTLISARNTGDDPLTAGRPLPGRPAHDLAYDAAWRFGPLVLRYQLDAVAGTTVDEGGTIVLPARVLHGAGAALDVPGARGLRASLEVDNLLDLRTLHARSELTSRAVPLPVSDFLGFPLPGRTLWLTLRWSHPHDE